VPAVILAGLPAVLVGETTVYRLLRKSGLGKASKVDPQALYSMRTCYASLLRKGRAAHSTHTQLNHCASPWGGFSVE
jgi:hypothetical protein